MEYLLYFYIAFSYLMVLGAKSVSGRIPLWNLLFAPLVLPIMMGRWITIMCESIQH